MIISLTLHPIALRKEGARRRNQQNEAKPPHHPYSMRLHQGPHGDTGHREAEETQATIGPWNSH